MSTRLHSAVLAAAVVCLAVGLGACEQADQSGGPGGNNPGQGGIKIGLLLPEKQTTRYEEFDRPLIEKKIKELCGDCTVAYANAGGDTATQHQQVDAMINNGMDVLILDPVDIRSLRAAVNAAEDADIPVVSYDRLVEGPVEAHVTYSSEAINRVLGKALLEGMGDKADGGQVVRVEGPVMKREATAAIEGKVKIKTYQATAWDAEKAHDLMSAAIADLGADNIDGVWAANDAIAAGVISALKAARVHPLPPVTGQDADLGALQRIVAGEQYMTAYKPFKPEADSAAEMAVALGRGERLTGLAEDRVNSPTTKDIPARLLTPTSVTVHNIESTVVKDGTYTIDQICTRKYRAACEKAGLV